MLLERALPCSRRQLLRAWCAKRGQRPLEDTESPKSDPGAAPVPPGGLQSQPQGHAHGTALLEVWNRFLSSTESKSRPVLPK